MRITWVSFAACAAFACGAEHAKMVEIEIERVEETVRVRTTRDGVEWNRAQFQLISGRATVVATATLAGGALAFEASASLSRFALGHARARSSETIVTLEIGGRRALFSDRAYRLDDDAERTELAAALAGTPLALMFAHLGPYHEGVTHRLPEAARIFDLIALSVETRPVEWPKLADPRDDAPPGMIPGDAPGLGMTCSENIRCPNAAPFCTTKSHNDHFGFCTRACESDHDCELPRGFGRCALPVWDVPAVSTPVLSCVIICQVDVTCPGILVCGTSFDSRGSCEPDNRLTGLGP